MAHKSEYELQRDRNIAANNQQLADLGLEGVFIGKPLLSKRKAPKRSMGDDPEWQPERCARTTRVTGRASAKAATTEPEEDDGSGSDGTGDEYAENPKKKEIPKPRRVLKTLDRAAADLPPDTEANNECIVIEPAKTGRSKCRRCMEPLNMGDPRVSIPSHPIPSHPSFASVDSLHSIPLHQNSPHPISSHPICHTPSGGDGVVDGRPRGDGVAAPKLLHGWCDCDSGRERPR